MEKYIDRALKFGLLFVGLCLSTTTVFANNGAEMTANGPTAAGMGGVSIALPQDATVAADNPAGMADVGTRIDLYGFLISVESNATFGTTANRQFSRIIEPAFGMGFNYQLGPQWTVGVSVTGAGLGAKYGEPALPIPGAGIAKSNLIIIKTSPTITYKPVPTLSLGVSLVLGLEQFRASGVLAPGADGPVALPSHGTSYATGIGAGFGVLWTPVPMVSLGASYYTKTWFSPLSGYKDDLFASSGGHLDSPSKYGVGIAVRPLPRLTLGLDYMRILWSQAAGFNTPASFNWHDQNVVRVGVAYEINEKWTVRTGFSIANSFMDSDHTLANYYANGIDDRAVTVGATYSFDKKNSLTMALEYDIPRTVVGTGPSKGTNISTNFQLYTIGYTHKF